MNVARSLAVAFALAAGAVAPSAALAVTVEPDATFGTGGVAIAPPTVLDNAGAGVGGIATRAAGGALVVQHGVGRDGRDLRIGVGVLAFAEDGKLDTAYGASGHGSLGTFGQRSLGIALDATGGAYVLLDEVGDDGVTRGMRVARLTPAGQLDRAFGTGGFQRLDVVAHRFSAEGSLKVIGQRVVVCGALGRHAAVQALLLDGNPDPRFGGGDGLVRIPRNLLGECASVSTASSSRTNMLVGGGRMVGQTADNPGHSQARIVKLTGSGRIDRTYGRGGVATVPAVRRRNNTMTVTATTTVGAAGVLVAGGWSRNEHPGGFLARLTYSGKVDRTFAAQGAIVAGSQFSSIAGAECVLATGAGAFVNEPGVRFFTARGKSLAQPEIPAVSVTGDNRGRLWTAGGAATGDGLTYSVTVRRLHVAGCAISIHGG